jgi:hypothetical protein
MSTKRTKKCILLNVYYLCFSSVRTSTIPALGAIIENVTVREVIM